MDPARHAPSQRSSIHRYLPVAVFFGLAICLNSFFYNLRDSLASPQQQAKISVTSDLVVLPVNVADSSGAFVGGLRKENFRVYEDGQLQSLSLFEEEDSPVTVGLIVDHSGSMAAKLPQVAAAVLAFAASSNPQDEMFVVDFSDRVSVESFSGEKFTNDGQSLRKALLSVSAEGQTALYDAIAEGLKQAETGSRGKKALIIVSDGGDNASVHKYSDILLRSRQAQAVVYSVALVGDATQEENPRMLERICRDTGGIAFKPGAAADVLQTVKTIARDLREQYVLGYAPPMKPRGSAFRKLSVQVERAGLRKVAVRTRSGYVARSSDPSPGSSGDKP